MEGCANSSQKAPPPYWGIEPWTSWTRPVDLLTWVDQFEPLAGILWIAVELQPQVVGCGDEGQPQHGWTGKGAQDVGRVVFAVIDLETKSSRSVADLRRASKSHPLPLVDVPLTFRMSPWARWKVLAEMLMPFPACTWREKHFMTADLCLSSTQKATLRWLVWVCYLNAVDAFVVVVIVHWVVWWKKDSLVVDDWGAALSWGRKQDLDFRLIVERPHPS